MRKDGWRMFRKGFLIGMLTLLLQGNCLAASTSAPASAADTAKDTKPVAVQAKSSTAPTGSTAAKDTAVKKAAQVNRYVKIFQDNSYIYMMDMQTARWINCPHTGSEQIIDVWIKLVNEDRSGTAAGKDGAYSYPSKYYLEHYYIRPSAQQIQFLCELEVTGRPNNAVKQRSYNAVNWEALVPGSLEDDIYHAVVAKMKKLTKPGAKGSPSLRDDIEEYLRISL